MQRIELHTESPAETQALGETIGKACRGGEIFLLEGDLGAGKTCLTQGIARGLAIDEVVTSPTFVLHCQYPGRLELNHFDAYRLADGGPLDGLGLDDLLGAPQTVAVVEWPEFLVSESLPACYHVDMTVEGPEARTIVVACDATAGMHILDTLGGG